VQRLALRDLGVPTLEQHGQSRDREELSEPRRPLNPYRHIAMATS